MPNEFKVKNGLIVDLGGANITGSVIATGGFTGSLLGTDRGLTTLYQLLGHQVWLQTHSHTLVVQLYQEV